MRVRTSILRSVVATNTDVNVAHFMRKVYAWMTLGMVITAATAWVVSMNSTISASILDNPFKIIILALLPPLMTVLLTPTVRSASNRLAVMLFAFYSILIGLATGTITMSLSSSTIHASFFVLGATYFAMTFYISVVKCDMSRRSSLTFMTVVGTIIMTGVALYTRMTLEAFVISTLNVWVFVALTALSVKYITKLANENEDTFRKPFIHGAVALYFGLGNLIAHILRLPRKIMETF